MRFQFAHLLKTRIGGADKPKLAGWRFEQNHNELEVPVVTVEAVKHLRGEPTKGVARHPLVELTDEEIRRVVGGTDMVTGSSTMTGSYNMTEAPKYCCDGVKDCCCLP